MPRSCRAARPWRRAGRARRSASTRSACWRRRSALAAVDRLLGGLLLGADLLGVRREPAAVPAHARPSAQVADPVHPLEQLAVVADHEQRAGPRAERRRRAGPGRRRRGCWSARRAAARPGGAAAAGRGRAGRPRRRRARRAAGRGCRREPEPVELGDRPLLDVPVVADRVEVGRVARRRRRAARIARRIAADAEQVVDRRPRSRVRSCGR